MIVNIVYVVVVGIYTTCAAPAQLNSGDNGCHDSLDCTLYAYDVCQDPQYYTWAMNNCRKYCGLCEGTSTSGQFVGVGKYLDEAPQNNSSTCLDKLTNCGEYGTKMCTDIRFFHWARQNCMSHCGLCDNVCVDKIANCADYGHQVCTNLAYYNWVHMHCRKFCGRCTS